MCSPHLYCLNYKRTFANVKTAGTSPLLEKLFSLLLLWYDLENKNKRKKKKERKKPNPIKKR